MKFALGTAIMGVAFLLFIPMAGGGANSAPLLGLIGILLVFTIAELLLSPVGLSLATKLAPEAFRTQMVSLFFLSVALGSVLAGYLGKFYSADHEAAYFGVLGLDLGRRRPGARRVHEADPTPDGRGPLNPVPGVRGAKARRQRDDPEDQHHRHREADPQGAGADQPGQHRAEQRADVVELVEPGDHRVDPGLPHGRVEALPAGDPGRGREAERGDHRDAGAEQREAERRPPARSGRTTTTARAAQATSAPTRSTRTAP